MKLLEDKQIRFYVQHSGVTELASTWVKLFFFLGGGGGIVFSKGEQK